ncbi:MAG: GAF domain-containing protein, partial [Colwellia sp.]
SDLLLKSLDEPETRTDEVKIVYYADKLSSSIADPCDEESFNDLLDAISAIMGVTVKQLKVRIEDTRQKSQELLSSYGASKLIDNIKALPHSKDFVEAKFKLKKIKLEKEASHNKDKLMLETISKLTLLAQSSKDVNDYFHLALKECVRIFDCQRGAFFMQMEDKFVVKSRFSVNSRQESENLNLTANITSVDNVIGQVIKNNSPLNLTKKAICEGPYLLGNELVSLLGNASLAILPIKIGKKMLGVVCVQQKEERDIFSAEDFNRMSVLFTHLSLCLNISVHLKTV